MLEATQERYFYESMYRLIQVRTVINEVVSESYQDLRTTEKQYRTVRIFGGSRRPFNASTTNNTFAGIAITPNVAPPDCTNANTSTDAGSRRAFGFITRKKPGQRDVFTGRHIPAKLAGILRIS